jgi:hypothetical protein
MAAIGVTVVEASEEAGACAALLAEQGPGVFRDCPV